MAETVNFMLCIFYHNLKNTHTKNKNKKPQKTTPTWYSLEHLEEAKAKPSTQPGQAAHRMPVKLEQTVQIRNARGSQPP